MGRVRLVQDFEDLAAAASSDAGLRVIFEDVARELGFEYIAVIHLPSLIRRSPNLIRYENYPSDWDRRLIGRGQRIIDPILSIARRRVSPLIWPDGLSGEPLTEPQRAILTEAVSLGIRQGITIPANVPGEPEGSTSFATARTRSIGRERQLITDAIGRIAFDAARRVADRSIIPNIIPHVSNREREWICWVAQGKTDEDIASILGIHLETVRSYAKSMFRKTGATNRSQIVYTATRLGLIDIVPSIPPFG